MLVRKHILPSLIVLNIFLSSNDSVELIAFNNLVFSSDTKRDMLKAAIGPQVPVGFGS